MWVSMIRTVLLYALILAMMRLMGKRQISQLQTSELVATLLLSELAVQPIQNISEPLLDGIAPMLVLVVFEIVLALLMLKSDKFRQLLCGKPIIVIEKGKVQQKAMRRLRMTTEDLSEHLRQKGAFSLDEVEYALIETNGMMSVMKKTEYEPLTPEVASIEVLQKTIEVIVVTDGFVSENSLHVCGQTEQWALEKIKNHHLTLKEVFIMTADADGNYRIIKREI